MAFTNDELTYNEPIDDTVNWGGDASTDFLPVSGQQVQAYIKGKFISEAANRENSDTQIKNSIKVLENTIWPLELVLNGTYFLKEYTGSAVSVPITAQVKRTGKGNVNTVDISSFVATLDGAACVSTPNSTGLYTLSVLPVSKETHKLIINVSAQGLNTSKTINIRLESKSYFGFSNYDDAGSIIPSTLPTNALIDSVKGTYVVNNSGSEARYLWVCIPTTVGTVSKVVTDSGFGIPMQPVQINNGYNCYRSQSKVNPGSSIKFTIS